MKLFDTALNALFPSGCLGCNEIIDNGESFCEYCFEMLDRCGKYRVCSKCGLIKKNCDCSNFIFHFDSLTAPFYANDLIKQTMYRLKFRREEYVAEFFAKEMALSVKQSFPDVKFDIITYVPMHPIKYMQRGYNQSHLIAKEISKILDIPLAEKLLSAKYKRKAQYKTSRKERFKNIKGKFSCKYALNGKNVLLVDDIKTTGATLDECSKQLFISGANSVYCVVGIINKKLKGK